MITYKKNQFSSQQFLQEKSTADFSIFDFVKSIVCSKNQIYNWLKFPIITYASQLFYNYKKLKFIIKICKNCSLQCKIVQNKTNDKAYQWISKSIMNQDQLAIIQSIIYFEVIFLDLQSNQNTKRMNIFWQIGCKLIIKIIWNGNINIQYFPLN
ncbi:unnamed protein product [Paramecium octaurelia]|uniref:Uncharacterized protein n=1 Tax=Paramecium octaurelia TaxID=43137 RepID=A0A8S1WTN6_PAROT|nr:unnamed protein product [Paramecium octaurelia]